VSFIHRLERYGRPTLDDVIKLKVNGTQPHVPIKYIQRIKKKVNGFKDMKVLLHAVSSCYQFDPKARPSALEILDILDKKHKKGII